MGCWRNKKQLPSIDCLVGWWVGVIVVKSRAGVGDHHSGFVPVSAIPGAVPASVPLMFC